MIQRLFDQAEAKISDLHNQIKEIHEGEKVEFLKESEKEICNSFTNQLNIKEREDLLSKPEYCKNMIKNSLIQGRELVLEPKNVDLVIQFLRDMSEICDSKSQTQN